MQKTTTPLENVVLWFMPPVPVLVFCLVFALTLFFFPVMVSGDGDLGRHLAVGNLILVTGAIPFHDVFSHTMPGLPLSPLQWLSEVLYALAYGLAGMNGVAWLTALVVASTFSLLTWGLSRMGVRAPVALAAGLAGVPVSALHALPRPHIFTWLLFTLFLLALEDYRRHGRRRRLAALPLLMVVWANVHGAFVLGFILVLMYAAGAVMERDARRALTLLGLVAFLVVASCINPAGPELLIHDLSALQVHYLADVTVEYQSANFHLPSTWPFVALLLLSLLLLWKRASRFSWTTLGLLGGWTALALYSARNIPLYAIAAIIVLAPVADELIGEQWPRLARPLARLDEIDRVSRGWVWALAVVALLVGLESSGSRFDVWRAGNDFNPGTFPVAAVNALKDAPPEGNMFNEFTWGGYLLFRLWPARRVYIDPQTDFYGEALTREYLSVANAEPGWNATLERRAVNWVIVKVKSPLAAQLAKSPAWTERYADNVAGVWVRR